MGIMRQTKSVKRILYEFEKEPKALSTVDLIKRLSQDHNKTTIYRVLDRLEDDGVLHSFQGTDGVKFYAKCHGCTKTEHRDIHPHFQCVSCGKMDCLDTRVHIPKVPNRRVLSSELLLQGHCEQCS
jgi:Fur family ferric uptake transcriptional regulator